MLDGEDLDGQADPAHDREDPLELLEEHADDLTPRQLAFVRALAAGASGTQAAIQAGYSEHTAAQQASRLLTYAKVQLALTDARRELARVAGLDAVWVLNRLKDVCDRSLQAEPVLDRQGDPTGEYVFNAAGANKAAELIGKQLGMFAPQKGVITLETLDRVLEQVGTELVVAAQEAIPDAALRQKFLDVVDRRLSAIALPQPASARAREGTGGG